MAYICTECGHIFDEGEEMHWTESHGEEFSGCPMCGGSFEQASHCKHCYGDFLEDSLYNGWCEECLRDMITYDNFWIYLKEHELVADFMFVNLWKSSVPETVSCELMTMMELTYKSLADYEKRFRQDELMKLCEDFICRDDLSKWDFAEWLDNTFEGVK